MVRRVSLAGLETSCLGFGCASLGSRVDAQTGLRSIGLAHDAGVTWFDLAPAYGAGAAEDVFSRFIKGQRSAVQICTKIGLAAPKRSRLVRALTPLVRPVAGMVKGVRSQLRRSPGSRNLRTALTGEAVRRGLETSLKRLGTDHVDLFALHSPDAADVVRDDVCRALEDLRSQGKALRLAVAGETAAVLAAQHVGAPYDVLQFADTPDSRTYDELISAGPVKAAVTHSILGIDGALATGVQRLVARPALQRSLAETGYTGTPAQVVSELLLDRALAKNAGGVVLTSMFGKRHLEQNVARARQAPQPRALQLAEQLFGDTESPSPGARAS